MIKSNFFLRIQQSTLAFSLLLAIPAIALLSPNTITAAAPAHYRAEETAFFDSLRLFLDSKRSEPKQWKTWCQEWTELLDKIPADCKPQFYKPLKEAVKKISRFNMTKAIGAQLKTALNLSEANSQIPQDIIERYNALGNTGILALIEASVRAPVIKK